MPVNRLIGTGFESFWLGDRMQTIWSIWWWHPNEAHNGYIEVLLNLGWIGIALLALLLITGYRNIISALRRNVPIASLELAYFLIAVIYSFTEAGFRMLAITWIFLLLAIAAARVPVPETEAETETETRDQYEDDPDIDKVALGQNAWADPEPET
jgi:O-antigen ligase